MLFLSLPRCRLYSYISLSLVTPLTFRLGNIDASPPEVIISCVRLGVGCRCIGRLNFGISKFGVLVEELFDTLSSLSKLQCSFFGVLTFELSLSECGMLPGSVLMERFSGGVRED